jgi:hypothetical protein
VGALDKFWKWFVRHEARLFSFDPSVVAEREGIFNELASELRKVDADLCFELSPKGTIREFVISAGGIKRAFPAVVALAGAAPTLARWKVTAFRPRRTEFLVVEIADRRVDPVDVQFSLLDNGSIAGISLFIPGFQETDVNFKQIGYLLLDAALGEYDVESRLGLIKMLPAEAYTHGDRYPLAELPARFDKLVARLARISAKPS